MKTLVKSRIAFCAREIREQLTRLQGEEWTCPAEDDEHVQEPGDEPAELQEEEQPEQDLHAAEFIMRCVHAGLGLPSKGLMLRLLRDANAP